MCNLEATPVPSKHLVILSPPSRFFSLPLALLASTYVLCNANYPLTYKLLLSSKEIFVLTGFSAIFLLAVGVITRLAAPQGLLDKAAMVAAAAAAAAAAGNAAECSAGLRVHSKPKRGHTLTHHHHAAQALYMMQSGLFFCQPNAAA